MTRHEEATIDMSEHVVHYRDEVVPIIKWFAPGFEDCEPSDATVVVAGPTLAGAYLTVQLHVVGRPARRPSVH